MSINNLCNIKLKIYKNIHFQKLTNSLIIQYQNAPIKCTNKVK